MYYGNSGYIGQSMSVRAHEAYDMGEMPLSKWTKTAILENIGEVYGEEQKARFSAFSVKELRDYFVIYSSWHHTGEYFNCTDFSAFDSSLTPEVLAGFEHKKAERKKAEIVTRWAVVSFDRWEGRFSHYKTCKHYRGIATWQEKNGKPGMVTVQYVNGTEQMRRSSIHIENDLARKPRKNEKIYKQLVLGSN